MSARYYIYSAVVVITLTIIISFLKQTRTRKEFFLIMAYVTGAFVLVVGGVIGMVQLLVWLGIAESGFVF